MQMSSKKFNPLKDFQSDQIQRSSRKIFIAHDACRNTSLNLTLVSGTTNGSFSNNQLIDCNNEIFKYNNISIDEKSILLTQWMHGEIPSKGH